MLVLAGDKLKQRVLSQLANLNFDCSVIARHFTRYDRKIRPGKLVAQLHSLTVLYLIALGLFQQMIVY